MPAVQTCSNNIPTIFLEGLDGLTTELASGTSDNDDFLRIHFLLVGLNCSGCEGGVGLDQPLVEFSEGMTLAKGCAKLHEISLESTNR